jgi:hypothetical protein
MTRASIDLRDERTARAHELLLERLRALTTSDQWLTMLELSRRFHTYSARNVLLLLAQGAEGRVAGYRTWQTIPAQYGGTCQVRKGAQSLTVLAPITRQRDETDTATGEQTKRRILVGFKGVRVFDETSLVAPPATPEVMPDLLHGESPQQIWHALAEQVRAAGFTLNEGDCSPANGRTDWLARTVTVRPDLAPAQRTKTLAHELAHVRLHDPTQGGEHRVSRPQMEVEAESVAYLVCAQTGIDAAQYTIPYVAHWANGDLELVQATAERVIDTARTITTTLEHDLTPNVEPTPQHAVPVPTDAARAIDRDTIDNPPAAQPTPLDAPRASPDDLAADELERIRTQVEARAAGVLAHLADNPDAWGAEPDQNAAIRHAARAISAPATPAVATARERLGQLLHPAAPPPPEPGPTLDAA